MTAPCGSVRPDDPSLLMRRGAAKRQQGQLLDATRDFEAAIRSSGGKFPQCTRLLVRTSNELQPSWMFFLDPTAHVPRCGICAGAHLQ